MDHYHAFHILFIVEKKHILSDTRKSLTATCLAIVYIKCTLKKNTMNNIFDDRRGHPVFFDFEIRKGWLQSYHTMLHLGYDKSGTLFARFLFFFGGRLITAWTVIRSRRRNLPFYPKKSCENETTTWESSAADHRLKCSNRCFSACCPSYLSLEPMNIKSISYHWSACHFIYRNWYVE